MSDYRDKLEEWQRAARRKARELDEKYDIKGRVEEGARVAQDAAKRGAETFAGGAERARAEAERFDDEYEVRERARRAAEEAARHAREAGEAFRQAAGSAGEKAGEVFDGAKNYYERASQVYDLGARLTRASAATTTGLFKAGGWVRENPGKAALATVSLVVGVRLGTAFPALDAVLLGSHPHWFTHSALPVYGLRKASEKFDGYLKRQETLIAGGHLDRPKKSAWSLSEDRQYVGARCSSVQLRGGSGPLGADFQPATSRAPSVALGGNPFLDGVWLFSNGCSVSIKAIVLHDRARRPAEVRRRAEIKGLCPLRSRLAFKKPLKGRYSYPRQRGIATQKTSPEGRHIFNEIMRPFRGYSFRKSSHAAVGY